MSQTRHASSESAFETLFEAGEAANLKIRAKLMNRLIAFIEASVLTQAQAADALGVGPAQVNVLLDGKIQKFSIDALLGMCVRAGITVDVVFGEAPVSEMD